MRWPRLFAFADSHGAARLTRDRAQAPCLDEIRVVMQQLTDEKTIDGARLANRIGHAKTATDLWHLREWLMTVLSRKHGERHSREVMHRIDAMFAACEPDSFFAGLNTGRDCPQSHRNSEPRRAGRLVN